MSISDKLTYLNTTKGKIKDSINLTGAGITNEPFRQYAVKLKDAYVDIINNGTETLYNNFPKVSGSGTDLSLQNTYEAPMRSTLKGNTSQEGTPTPDSPQDIHNVSGNNDIEVCGKNLFDKDNANVINGYIRNEGTNFVITSQYTNKTIMFVGKPNTTYTISKKLTDRFRVGLYNSALSEAGTYDLSSIIRNDSGTKITITTTSTDYYIYAHILETDDLDEVLATIQIEYGNQATTYEAYNGTTYPINLGSIELCKIGTYQDYIYKENDKWYLHKEIGKVVFDGSETWSKQDNSSYSNTILRFRSNVTNIDDTSDVVVRTIANYFKGGNLGTRNVESITTQFSGSAINIFIDQSRLSGTDVSDFTTWLTTHNTITYFVYKTPTYTEITDNTLLSQLEAIYNANSKNGTTNINQENNDLPFIITASALEKE